MKRGTRVMYLFILSTIICNGCSNKIYKGFLKEIAEPKTAFITVTTDGSFAADSSIKGQRFYYKTLYGLDNNSVFAHNKIPAKLYVQRPTLVNQEGQGAPLLLLPEDSLNIEFDIYGQMKFVAPSRQREMQLRNFNDWYYFLDSLGHKLSIYSLSDSIAKEPDVYVASERFQSKVSYYVTVGEALLNQMFENREAESEVKRSFRNYLYAYFINSKLNYYWETKKNSKIGNVYDLRYNELVSFFNAIRTHEELNFYYSPLWELFRQMVTYKLDVPAIYDSASLKVYLAEARRIFSGVSYNYLVANTIYYAYKNKGINGKEFIGLKNEYIQDKYYKAALSAIIKTYQDAEFFVNTNKDNSFVSLAGNSSTSENNLFEKFKGKLVFVDFWSSWCIPCRKEMPAMRTLKKEYVGKEIVFITISIDNSLLAWQKASKTEDLGLDNNFLLKKEDSVFKFKERIINEIPRYFLLGKDGSIITDNAPSPGDESLKKLIDQYL